MKGAGLGSWLEERCKAEGLSLRQASIKTGLSHTTIADLMKGNNPSPETLRKLAQAFNEGGDHHRMAIEDELLTLAGYRSERLEGEELSQPLAQLMDIVGEFSQSQLKIMARFAEFLAEIPVKGGQKRGTGRHDATSFLKKERR